MSSVLERIDFLSAAKRIANDRSSETIQEEEHQFKKAPSSKFSEKCRSPCQARWKKKAKAKNAALPETAGLSSGHSHAQTTKGEATTPCTASAGTSEKREGSDTPRVLSSTPPAQELEPEEEEKTIGSIAPFKRDETVSLILLITSAGVSETTKCV